MSILCVVVKKEKGAIILKCDPGKGMQIRPDSTKTNTFSMLLIKLPLFALLIK